MMNLGYYISAPGAHDIGPGAGTKTVTDTYIRNYPSNLLNLDYVVTAPGVHDIGPGAGSQTVTTTLIDNRPKSNLVNLSLDPTTWSCGNNITGADSGNNDCNVHLPAIIMI